MIAAAAAWPSCGLYLWSPVQDSETHITTKWTIFAEKRSRKIVIQNQISNWLIRVPTLFVSLSQRNCLTRIAKFPSMIVALSYSNRYACPLLPRSSLAMSRSLSGSNYYYMHPSTEAWNWRDCPANALRVYDARWVVNSKTSAHGVLDSSSSSFSSYLMKHTARALFLASALRV